MMWGLQTAMAHDSEKMRAYYLYADPNYKEDGGRPVLDHLHDWYDGVYDRKWALADTGAAH